MKLPAQPALENLTRDQLLELCREHLVFGLGTTSLAWLIYNDLSKKALSRMDAATKEMHSLNGQYDPKSRIAYERARIKFDRAIKDMDRLEKWHALQREKQKAAL